MPAIYADIIFLLNTLVDYLVILMTGRLSGIPLRRRRFLSAALLGGIYAVFAAYPVPNLLNGIFTKILIWLLMTLIAFGYSDQFIREALLLLSVSCVLAGVVLALGSLFRHTLYLFFTPRTCIRLLSAGILLCFLASVPLRCCVQNRIDGMVFPVFLSVAGREAALSALLDTGNHLRDPVTGAPLLVVSSRALNTLLPQEWTSLIASHLSSEMPCVPEPVYEALKDLSPKLIPYRSLGLPSGTLLTLQTDWIKIQNTVYHHANIAISPYDLGLGYSALWGGTLKGDSMKP